MTFTRICFFLAIFFVSQCFCLQTYGQDSTIGKISIASPNAASLGKYGDIPVSYHTGIPQISIPIYTIKSGSLTLPIGISYHASGLKVQEQASWVGAGWTLNAGGAITRTVVGAPDDRGIDAAHTTYGHFSDYGYNSYLFTVGSSACGQPPCPIGATNPPDDQSIAGGVKDGEPDLYFFNFNGHTGKFYFNDDRTPILVPEEDYKITPIYPYTQAQVSLYGILGFIITTPDGVRYYFGKNQSTDGNIDAMEITTDITSQAPSNTQQGAVSSWFLNKIVSADDMDSIKLIYQPDKFSYYGLSMFPVYPNAGNTFLSSNAEYDLLKNFISGVRLSKITFANGEVDFNPGSVRQDLGDYNSQIIGDVANTQSPSLGSIRITDNNGYCKKDSFYYSYFQDSTTTLTGFFSDVPNIYAISSDKYRLRLDSVQESSCDDTLHLPPYRFTYFGELVPRKLSFGIDHWGFCNGATNNQTLVPTYTVIASGAYTIIPGADRDAHWPAMRGGALQKIQYPTGGTTTFDFEPHDTYVNFTSNVQSTFTTFTVGYGNTSISGSFTAPAATYYEMDMVSTQSASGGASLEIKNSSGVSMFSEHINSQTSRTFTFTLSPGAYTYTFSDQATETMDGASATMYRFGPVTTSGNTIVGGLRIKTITGNDGVTSNDMVTSYTYKVGGTSTGILYSRPVYVQQLRNDVYHLAGSTSNTCSANGCISCDGSGAMTYYRSPSSIRPMGTTQGYHIGYNEVQVSQTNNGHIVYRYYGSNLWDNIITDVCTRNIDISSCSLDVPNFPAAPLPFEYLRGELKYEGHYNEAGHTLKDATYFPKYVQDSVFTPGYIAQLVYVGSVGSFIWGTEYRLQSAAKVKDSIITTTWDTTGGSVQQSTSIIYYNSPFHHQPTRKVTTTSTGDSLLSNYTYAADFRAASCDTIPNGWHPYYLTYVADSVTFNVQDTSCTNTGGWNCKYLAYQQYRFDKAQHRQAYINLRRTNFTDSGSVVAACQVNARNAADALLKPILRLQDEYRNPPVELSEWYDLNLKQAAFTRYDTSMSPVGHVYPGMMQSLKLQTPSGSFTPSAVSGNSISRDSRYQTEQTFLLSNGTLRRVTGHDGMPITYIWDYSNAQPVAKVMNATPDQVAYTSFETDGTGGWTVPSGGRDVANSITGSSSYNLTNGACSATGLVSSNLYVVSYWSKSGNSYTVTGSTSVKQGKTINGWTYYEHTATGVSTLSVTGTNDIDELRLYPASAQMTTFTYTPLLGITSQCDAVSRLMYYSYDRLGRLKSIKDQDGNIIKLYDYQYQVLPANSSNP